MCVVAFVAVDAVIKDNTLVSVFNLTAHHHYQCCVIVQVK